MSFLRPDQVQKIEETVGELEAKYNRLILTFNHHQYKTEQGAEYARQGYMRRLGTIKRCIENVFTLIPPQVDETPDRNVLHDAQINIQSFFANIYGAVDNLAWVWVYERSLERTVPRARVGLRAKHAEVRSSLSRGCQNYLQKLDQWFDYVVEYRDALAHRIPLYIPPGRVRPNDVDAYNNLSRRITDALYAKYDGVEYSRLSAQQEKLLTFQPLITHSVKETTAHFAFHAQMPTDFLTVEELGYKLLAELKAQRKGP